MVVRCTASTHWVCRRRQTPALKVSSRPRMCHARFCLLTIIQMLRRPYPFVTHQSPALGHSMLVSNICAGNDAWWHATGHPELAGSESCEVCMTIAAGLQDLEFQEFLPGLSFRCEDFWFPLQAGLLLLLCLLCCVAMGSLATSTPAAPSSIWVHVESAGVPVLKARPGLWALNDDSRPFHHCRLAAARPPSVPQLSLLALRLASKRARSDQTL